MQLPQVNLNGTSRDALLDQYRDAYRAINDAIDALCKAAPHGRDYQTLPAGSYNVAREEHDARLVKLGSIKAEIEAIAIHIQD
jgi:hypothetical protein